MSLMNRQLLFGAAFFFAGIQMSAAADMVLPDTADSDWTGLYATLSGGYTEVELKGNEFEPDIPVGSPFADDKSTSGGAIFGLGLGYDHDLGDFVIGLEGDVSLLTNDERLELKNTVDAEYDWFATGRLRAGYDFDGTLFYATGGVALLAADFEDDRGASDEQTYVGWTVGGGIEHMFSDRLSFRLEGLYADFPRKDIDLDADDTDIEAAMFVVRAGIGWRFFSP